MIQSQQIIKDGEPHRKLQRQQDIYQRIKVLGTGSFGRAYLVKQKSTDEFYVIKQIDIADLTPQEQQNTRKQAKILQALSHPNIVKFKEIYGTSKMKLNIVMEYADGGDLAAKIASAKQKQQYFEQNQILNWFTQICLGIKHIHDRKIIHRDMKGQNIFLTQDNCIKIGDFGVARVLQQTHARAKTFVGSPYYLSPEIIQNKPYSFKSDIWSLGALLYEMCALQPPFKANNIQFLALKIVKGSFQSIPSRYSSQLKQLIKWMLNTNSNTRPNINQILSSPIINRRIKMFLTQSQNIKEFSHTVIHKYNPLKPTKKQYSSQEQSFEKLGPPPNLMELENESVSHISNPEPNKKFIEEKSQNKKIMKFRPPLSSKRPSGVKRPQDNNLGDIMQIKPSHIQAHQPQVKLPKVTPSAHQLNAQKIRPKTPKLTNNKNIRQQNDLLQHRKIITCSNFSKKKMINCQKKIQIPKQLVQQQKQKQIAPENIPSNIISKKTPQISQNNIKKGNIIKHQSKKRIQAKQKKITNKIKPETAKKQKKRQKPLEMVSQQAKQKIQKQKNLQKKKTIKPQTNSVKRNHKKEENSSVQKLQQRKIQEQSIFQQEKCQNSNNDYQEDFQHYDNLQQSPKTSLNLQSQIIQDVNNRVSNQALKKQSSLQLSDSCAVRQSTVQNQNFNKMVAEMQIINQLVQEANGLVDNLPMLGSDVPEMHLSLSQSLRQDDNDLQSAKSSRISNIEQIKKTSLENTLQNLNCLADPGQIQNLRIVLEQIFGLQNLIKVYNKLQDVIRRQGLDFSQQKIIQQTIQGCEVQELVLKKYFRHVVCVIVLETQMQFANNQ